MNIVNYAVRTLVLAFVFVGGAITFAGPQTTNTMPAEVNKSADTVRETGQEVSAAEQSRDNNASQDVG